MRDALKRLERLEDAIPATVGPVFVGWQGEAVAAISGGERLLRECGEDRATLTRRAAKRFPDAQFIFLWVG